MSTPLTKTTLSFSGRKEDWNIFAFKFKSLCKEKGYKNELLGKYERKALLTTLPATEDVNLIPTTTTTAVVAGDFTPTSIDQISDKSVENNDHAYSLLSLALHDKMSLQIIMSARTTLFKEGDAAVAWSRLEEVYTNKGEMEEADLEEQFNNSKLNVHDDPDKWFNALEEIRTRLIVDYENVIDEKRMIKKLTTKLPTIYEPVTEALINLRALGKVPTLEDVKNRIRDRFSRHNQQRGTRNNTRVPKGEETALIASRSKQFKGTCTLCGKYGHKRENCWDDDKNKNNRPNNKNNRNSKNNNSDSRKPTANNHSDNNQQEGDTKRPFCRYCKKVGHTRDECNKLKNKREEYANVTQESEYEDEVALVSIVGNKFCLPITNTETTSTNFVPNSFFDNFITEGKESDDGNDDVIDNLDTLTSHANLLSATATYKQELIATTVDNNTWILDSGATSHMKNNLLGMTNLVPQLTAITIGDGTKIEAKYRGDYRCTAMQMDGNNTNLILKDVLVVPNVSFNLFSQNVALKNGAKISNDDELITLRTGKIKLNFDRKIPAGSGHLSAIELLDRETYNLLVTPEIEKVEVKIEKDTVDDDDNAYKQLVNINTLHSMLGHCNKDTTKSTARYHNFETTGRMHQCADCAIAKAKRKSVKKKAEVTASQKGDKAFLDISYISAESCSGKRYWCLLEDENTNMLWSLFLKSKSEVKTYLVPLLKKIHHETGVMFKVIRCDNAPEHVKLQRAVEDDHLITTKIEFTAPYTPQMNGVVERKFATLRGVKIAYWCILIIALLRIHSHCEGSAWKHFCLFLTTRNENCRNKKGD